MMVGTMCIMSGRKSQTTLKSGRKVRGHSSLTTLTL